MCDYFLKICILFTPLNNLKEIYVSYFFFQKDNQVEDTPDLLGLGIKLPTDRQEVQSSENLPGSEDTLPSSSGEAVGKTKTKSRKAKHHHDLSDVKVVPKSENAEENKLRLRNAAKNVEEDLVAVEEECKPTVLLSTYAAAPKDDNGPVAAALNEGKEVAAGVTKGGVMSTH